MARIQLKDLNNNLDWAKAKLLEAAEKDGIVSRQDFRDLLETLEDGSKARFLELLYQFFRKLEDDRPRMRVTREVIEHGVAFIKEEILPQFEIADFFTVVAKQDISNIHAYALPLANQLRRTAEDGKGLLAEDVANRIATFTADLFFDDFGSESSAPIEAFYQTAELEELTPTGFAESLGLDPDNPADVIASFTEADEAFMVFIDQHYRFGLAEKAIAIVDLMQANLQQAHVIILGEDYNPSVPDEHPTYVVGVGKDGGLAGFRTMVVWT